MSTGSKYTHDDKQMYGILTELVSDLFVCRILNVYFMKTANVLVYGYITVYGYVLNY